MKLTDLVGRLAPFYSGIQARPIPNYDGWEITVPGHDSVVIAAHEMHLQKTDDQVVELVLSRIKRHAHA
jgi:hypothetical protein